MTIPSDAVARPTSVPRSMASQSRQGSRGAAMTLLGLALRNVRGSGFRSWAIAACVLVMAGLSLTSTLIIRGTESSLRLGLERLGADIVVVPEGVEPQMESALFTGRPAPIWMAADRLAMVASLPGVASASPQLFLGSLRDTPLSTSGELHVMAYDPATDFTVRPWLLDGLAGGLEVGEAVGGSQVVAPEGQTRIAINGLNLQLRSRLEPTGSGLDQTLFVTFETARELLGRPSAGVALEAPAASLSAVMVRVVPGTDPHEVALRIMQEILAVTPIETPSLYRAFQKQLVGLAQGILLVLAILWGLSILVIGLIFSMAANERRREIAVLRALGATRLFVFQSLLAEAALLALGGGLFGILAGASGSFLLKDLIVASLEVPFLFPSPSDLAILLGAGLGISLAVVILAALAPAYRISGQEPALAMKE